MKIVAKISRGKNVGSMLYPHLHADGYYVVSETRFERDYIRVSDLHEVASYTEKGFKLRMSNPSEGISAASLISPASISIGS